MTTMLAAVAGEIHVDYLVVEDMGIPCFLGGMSRGMLGRDNPLQIRQKRRDALREADVILLAGNVNVIFFMGLQCLK